MIRAWRWYRTKRSSTTSSMSGTEVKRNKETCSRKGREKGKTGNSHRRIVPKSQLPTLDQRQGRTGSSRRGSRLTRNSRRLGHRNRRRRTPTTTSNIHTGGHGLTVVLEAGLGRGLRTSKDEIDLVSLGEALDTARVE